MNITLKNTSACLPWLGISSKVEKGGNKVRYLIGIIICPGALVGLTSNRDSTFQKPSSRLSIPESNSSTTVTDGGANFSVPKRFLAVLSPI